MGQDEVNSIRYLVANSVEGLQIDDVAVVDSGGNVLTENMKDDGTFGAASSQMKLKKSVEDYLSNKVETMLAKVGSQHCAVQATTLDFLRQSVLQRERPELIVMDPPRAGLGGEVSDLLMRIGAQQMQMVYVSCDPATLGRDLRVMVDSGYRVEAMHLLDLFPQTFHLETIAILKR